MKHHHYTADQVQFLRAAYPYLTIGSLTRAFNVVYDLACSQTQIRCTLKRYGIRSGRVPKLFAEQRLLRVWTTEQADFLRANYPGRLTAELTELFNRRFGTDRTVRQINTFLKNRGLSSGVRTCFGPGNRPHNYGKKGWQAGGNAVKTQFKPGNRPHTWVPIGSERINKDGIRQRKISDTGYCPRDWQSVHSLLWEEHHGPIPSGHIVVFRQGNEIRIDNLELITRAENMCRNSVHHLPKELVRVIRIRGKLNRRIKELEQRI